MTALISPLPQVVHWRADHFGGFNQANIKFGLLSGVVQLNPLACARHLGEKISEIRHG